MGTSILVAGGAGYIGSHVCKALAQAGHTPVTLDDFSAGRRDFVRWGPLVEANVANADAVRHALSHHNIKAVIDLAGSIEVAESVADPLKYYENNVACKIAFLRALSEASVRAFIFSSSAAVYGEPQTPLIQETHPLRPKNPYGWSKLMFEQALRDLHAAGGPPWVALRYFNAAGASPDGDIGESHDPETHLIPRACNVALGLSPALAVFGKDYPTPDGTAVRDYVHVTDLACAHVLALEMLLKGAPANVYNLGTGTGISVGEVLAGFAELGWNVAHHFEQRRAGDPSHLVADATAAKRDLGWTPRHSDLPTIIRSACRWHEIQSKRY